MMAHLVACTLAAAAALGAAWALRRGPARWRYALLLAALLRFAVPTSWLDAAGRSMAPILPAPLHAPQALEDLRRLLVHPTPSAPPPAVPAHKNAQSVYELIWAAGAAVCLLAWARQFRVRPAAVRPPDSAEFEAFQHACAAVGISRLVELRIVAAEWVPGAVGMRHPAVALPNGLAAQLTAEELEGVLAHELAHILRRDNLWAAVAHAVVAAFWFHPLVWWMERRLLEEREAACDELVLRRGACPETYLSGILKVCRMAFAGAAGYAGANGSNLEIRMERIMNVPHASRFERTAAGALVALAVLFPLAGGYLKAQSQRQTDDQVQSSNLFDQGSALLKQKDYAEALGAFRRSYQLNPDNIRSLLGMTEVESATGRNDEAVALLEQEAARRPERHDLQMALGNTAVRAGQYDLAVSVFNRLLGVVDPNSAVAGDIYLRLGETYRRAKKLPEAIAALRRSVELKPDSPVQLSTLALVLDNAGNVGEARQAYLKVLEIDPHNGVAMNNAAFLMAAHGGNLDEALKLARDAQLFLPLMAEVNDTLGYVYLTRKEPGDAFTAFREAVLQDLANPTFRHHMLDAVGQMTPLPANASALQEALRAEPTTANQDLVRKLLQ